MHDAETTPSAAQVAAQGIAEWRMPTRLSGLVFRAKMGVFQARRLAIDLAPLPGKLRPVRLKTAPAAAYPVLIAQSRTALYADDYAGEHLYQLGKVHNLRRAARDLDGLVLTPGAVFSFWKQVGPTTRAKGYATGRMLQEGCLSPATGGGLCQLSSALYDAALQARLTIVERHAHSRIVPGSTAARLGRDATIAWNYVDLRFAAPDIPLRLGVALTRDELVVTLHGPEGVTAPPKEDPALFTAHPQVIPFGAARSCATCEETDCHLHEAPPPPRHVRTAWLVDEAWPEFAAHVAASRTEHDLIAQPFDPRLGKGRGRWSETGFASALHAAPQALWRSAQIRRLAASGPARRRAELEGAGPIARALARRLPPDIERVCVAQSLLPFLWREGALGGRPFDVMMTRLPMAELHARLDAAFAAHPDRPSLADFRAPAWLVEAESEALAAADRLLTPHLEIARLFRGRSRRLPWQTPAAVLNVEERVPDRIYFPGPTAARKGAFEVRAAARALNLEVVLGGSDLEGPDFWTGLRTCRAEALQGEGGFTAATALVHPALVEDQPRTLLRALAAGLPVITTPASGLAPAPGLTLIPAGDTDALIAALT